MQNEINFFDVQWRDIPQHRSTFLKAATFVEMSRKIDEQTNESEIFVDEMMEVRNTFRPIAIVDICANL